METVGAHRADGIWCVCVCGGGVMGKVVEVLGGGKGKGKREGGRCLLYLVHSSKGPGADDASLPEFRLLDKAQLGQVRLSVGRRHRLQQQRRHHHH